MSKVSKIGRKAGNGRYCTVKWAQDHPRIAVVETRKEPKK